MMDDWKRVLYGMDSDMARMAEELQGLRDGLEDLRSLVESTIDKVYEA